MLTRKNLLILLVTCALLISPIHAAGIQATPPDFKYNLNPGEFHINTIKIINTGNTPLKVEILPKRLRIDNKQITYNDTGIAQWIKIPNANFTLKPHEHHQILFKLTIPTGLDYNDALGALLIHATPQTQNSNFFMDLVIPLHVSVPGPIRESILILNHDVDELIFSGMNSDIQTTLKNNGTIKTNITSTTTIKGLTGEYVVSNSNMVYPGDETTLNYVWKSNWWDLGFYQIKTTISYNNFGEDKTISYNHQILVIPLWLIILIMGIIVLYLKKK